MSGFNDAWIIETLNVIKMADNNEFEAYRKLERIKDIRFVKCTYNVFDIVLQ